MRPLSIKKYWKRLENHNWFYAWIQDDKEYEDHVLEAKKLFHMSRLSERHGQLYTAYWTGTFFHANMDDNEVLDTECPIDGRPEAA